MAGSCAPAVKRRKPLSLRALLCLCVGCPSPHLAKEQVLCERCGSCGASQCLGSSPTGMSIRTVRDLPGGHWVRSSALLHKIDVFCGQLVVFKSCYLLAIKTKQNKRVAVFSKSMLNQREEHITLETGKHPNRTLFRVGVLG